MSIAMLSDQTVRLLGASQQAPTPESIIKELLDNAIDAAATSVQIEIAANLLDFIQVRDNGHGIADIDRPMLCKRNCTSKIAHLDDLKSIGGQSLGFRGTALASILSSSGSVHITTRVATDPVGSLLKLSPNASSQKQSTAAPVGTTVRVIEIFKALPVRRQAYRKSSQKNIAKTKHMLREYALAHPSIRISLHISSSNEPRQGLVYAASAVLDLEQAAMKVVGRECVNQCTTIAADKHGFILTALLPKADAECALINGHGVFIAIDARPVSSTQGLLQKLRRRFKERFSSAASQQASAQNPFGVFQFKCPLGAYDVNIEPLKDDVLFEDSNPVTELIEDVLEKCYGHSRDVIDEADSYAASLATRDSRADPTSAASEHWACLPKAPAGHFSEDEEQFAGASDSNPWILAKMNSLRRPEPYHAADTLPSQRSNRQHLGRSFPPTASTEHIPDVPIHRAEGFETPPQSSPRTALGRIDCNETRPLFHGAVSSAGSVCQPRKEYDTTCGHEQDAENTTPPPHRSRSSKCEPEPIDGFDYNYDTRPKTPASAPKRSLKEVISTLRPLKQPRLSGSMKRRGLSSANAGDEYQSSAGARAHAPYQRPQFVTKRLGNTGRRRSVEAPDEFIDEVSDGPSTSPVRDASTRGLSRQSSPAASADYPLGRQAPLQNDATHSPMHRAENTDAEIINRAVAALHVSMDALRECCQILRATKLDNNSYPDLPLEPPSTSAREGMMTEDEDEDGCATPETLRPSSLSAISDEEMEPWRQQLLDYLAREGVDGLDAVAT